MMVKIGMVAKLTIAASPVGAWAVPQNSSV